MGSEESSEGEGDRERYRAVGHKRSRCVERH
jgi:hypothetical protein